MRRTAKFVVLPLLILGFAFLLRASIPHIPTGTWQAGNPMAEARSGAASVLLSSGSVLITGGDGTTGTLNTAEVMSNAGIFSSVASMQSPRSGHTATALQDGRVLITGGTTATGGGATNSAEVYDPSANSWTLVNSAMLAARTGHTASPLPDGRVLLAGGSNSGGPARLRLAPESYERLCRAVLHRDGWRCQACGSFTNLQIHHKELRSRSGDDSEDNLITLCSVCHGCLHRSR